MTSGTQEKAAYQRPTNGHSASTGNGRAQRPDPPADPPMRASDDDRLATVARLQDAVARGLLTPDEGSERMAAAFAAAELRALGPLTADLPTPKPRVEAPGWRPLAAMAAEQVRAGLRDARTDRLSARRIALVVAVLFVLVLLFGSLLGAAFDGGGHGNWHGGWDHH